MSREYDPDYWAETEAYWNKFIEPYDGLNREEVQHVAELFYGFLRDVDQGVQVESSPAWYELREYLGIHYSEWNWEDFRDWYDAA
jgi:hypothetical protein